MYLNLRCIKNAFFMSLTPLLYRYPTIALYDRAAASRKEEFGILAVLSHSHHLCDQHVHYTNALAFCHVIFRLSSLLSIDNKCWTSYPSWLFFTLKDQCQIDNLWFCLEEDINSENQRLKIVTFRLPHIPWLQGGW